MNGSAGKLNRGSETRILGLPHWSYDKGSVSGKVLVKDGCSQGPEFWCQDLLTAVQCGAVDHCKETVWKEEEDVLCMQCKQIVTILLNMVKASPIQNKIKTFLHKECSHIPVYPLVEQCNHLVDEYESVLITLLENQFNPQTICSFLRICHSDQSVHWDPELLANHILKKIVPRIQEDFYNFHSKVTQEQRVNENLPMPMCWMCKSFIGRFEAAIPKTAIATMASQLCLVLPAKIAGVCQCLVEKYTVILLDVLLAKLGPQLVCGLLFMCATEENCEADLPVIPMLTSDLTCDTCLTVTSLMKSTIDRNVTQAEVVAAILRVCTDPSLDSKECQTFLQKHQTELSQFLHKPWDNKMTCQAVGACPAHPKATPEDSGCAVGPSYWCRSLDTAKECQAVNHCLTHVWH
ncbi:pulmonary surfactant-associated protein B [Rhinophrynus dorsalis]